MQVGLKEQRRSATQARLTTNGTLQPLTVLLEYLDQSELLVDVTKRSGEHDDSSIEASVGPHVGNAHPVETFVIDAIELFSNDLAQQLI